MTYRNIILAAMVAAIATTGAFASGNNEDDSDNPGYGRGGRYSQDEDFAGRGSGRDGGRGGQGGHPGMRGSSSVDEEAWMADREAAFEERQAELLEEAETYEGTFTMVEDQYPAIIDSDGNTWYIMSRFIVDEESIPEEGAEVVLKALPARMSPIHLMVVQAEVDGELIEPAIPEPGGMGRQGGNPDMGRGGRKGGFSAGQSWSESEES